jgi:hypothetical protein
VAARLKTLLSLTLFLLLVWSVIGRSDLNSPAYDIPRQVLDGGGAMWLSTASYKLSSSLGQSITGVQEGATKTLYTGFWNPWVVEASPVEWEEMDYSQRPSEFALRQNYPNPFNPATVIEYALPKISQVKIDIYNILGQKVRNLVDELQEPGYKTIQWDAKDGNGVEVSSGVYFFRIEAGDFVDCKKMTLLK